MNFGTDISSPQRMNPDDCVDPLTLYPPAGQPFHLYHCLGYIVKQLDLQDHVTVIYALVAETQWFDSQHPMRNYLSCDDSKAKQLFV